MVFALRSEAVSAVQVAGVSNVEAERLDDVAAAFLEGACQLNEVVLRPELACFFQRGDVAVAEMQLFLGDVVTVAVFCHHVRNDLVLAFVRVELDHIVSYFIHGVNRAAAAVQHDVVAVEFVLMYHVGIPPIIYIKSIQRQT